MARTCSYNSYSSSLTSNLLLRFMGDMRSDAFLADGRLVVPQRGNSFRLRQPDGSEGDAVVLEGADSVRCGSCSRVFRPGLDSGTVWSSAPDRYVLEQHQADGTLLRRITRRAEWFETAPPDSVARRTEGEEELLDLTSRSQFASVTQTADGLLWTLSYVNNPADPLGIDFIRAITAIASQSSGSLGQMPAPEDLLSHFVTRVEVIDPATNELLASETFPGLLRALRRDLVAEFTWNAQGGPAWKVYRLSLTGR